MCVPNTRARYYYCPFPFFNLGCLFVLFFVGLWLMLSINVYCPECPPGGTIGHPGVAVRSRKGLLHLTVPAYRTSLFRIGRDHPFGTRKMTRASGAIHYTPTDPHVA